MTTVAGIVLAGGAAQRFGRDKLAIEVEGRTLLERSIGAVGAVAGVVVVALAAWAPEPALRTTLTRRPELVRDPTPGGGPLMGLATALEAAARLGADVAIVVGGDMPWIRPAVLGALLSALDDAGIDACAPLVEGVRRPLPVALRVGPALEAAEARLAGGRGSLLGPLELLRTTDLAEKTWRALDPAGDTFRDVDRPSDLERSGRAETGDPVR